MNRENYPFLALILVISMPFIALGLLAVYDLFFPPCNAALGDNCPGGPNGPRQDYLDPL